MISHMCWSKKPGGLVTAKSGRRTRYGPIRPDPASKPEFWSATLAPPQQRKKQALVLIVVLQSQRALAVTGQSTDPAVAGLVISRYAPVTGASSEQRLAAGRGNTPALARRPAVRTGAERGLDGVGDELGGLGVDGDVAAEQHPADNMAGVPGRVLRAVGHVSPLS